MNAFKLATIAAASLVLLASEASAACVFNPRYENGQIRWDPVVGAERYNVLETGPGLTPLLHIVTRENAFRINRIATVDTKLTYYVTAIYRGGISSQATASAAADSCTDTIEVTIPGNPAFRALTRRAIIPIVGSAPGAFNGRFKTSVRLVSTHPAQRGKLVFRAAGRPGSANDPSIRYDFTAIGQTKEWADVVDAMGQTGLGSIDVIPDDNSEPIVPSIETRVYNETTLGTFGSNVETVLAFDAINPPAMDVALPTDDRFRVNVGFRTIEPSSVKMLIYGPDTRLLDLRDLELPADYMQLTPLTTLAGPNLVPGGHVTFLITGAAASFYTTTENLTNDPTVYVTKNVESGNVGQYVE